MRYDLTTPAEVQLGRDLYASRTLIWTGRHPSTAADISYPGNTSAHIIWQAPEAEGNLVLARGVDAERNTWYCVADATDFVVGSTFDRVSETHGRVIGVLIHITGGGNMEERLVEGQTTISPIDLCSSVQYGVKVADFAGHEATLWISTRKKDTTAGWKLVKSISDGGTLVDDRDREHGIAGGALAVVRDNGMLNIPLWMKLARPPR